MSGITEANATVQIAVNGQTYNVTADSTGAWVLPTTATLPDGTYTPVITAIDAAGNSSTVNGTPFTVDTSVPATPGVQIPEAIRGVSTAEAADGVSLVIKLPNDAVVGDILTTVVTPPGGGAAITLTHVILASELPAGQGGTATGTGPFTITQTVLQAQLLSSGSSTLYRDGTWATSTTLTDAAGNTSAAQTDGFELSANAPTLTLATTAGDGIVNALEKTGDVPVSGSTSAEVGQPVTVQLMSGSTVLGTYYTVVKADGSFALNIPQADLPADGIYTLTADVSNFAGTPAAQASQPVTFDTTAPTISVTSVAGNAVTGSQNGEFSAAERGPLNDNTVDVLPVISGTTDAEVGQTVTLTLNSKAYTTTVLAGGTWSYTLSNADALALNHGSTYAITASVKDVAGNAGSDTDNSLIANIANPDIPTVVELYTGNHTPTITGRAQKDAGGSYIALANGDQLSVTVNSVTYSLTIGGSSAPAGLSYNATNST